MLVLGAISICVDMWGGGGLVADLRGNRGPSAREEARGARRRSAAESEGNSLKGLKDLHTENAHFWGGDVVIIYKHGRDT